MLIIKEKLLFKLVFVFHDTNSWLLSPVLFTHISRSILDVLAQLCSSWSLFTFNYAYTLDQSPCMQPISISSVAFSYPHFSPNLTSHWQFPPPFSCTVCLNLFLLASQLSSPSPSIPHFLVFIPSYSSDSFSILFSLFSYNLCSSSYLPNSNPPPFPCSHSTRFSFPSLLFFSSTYLPILYTL